MNENMMQGCPGCKEGWPMDPEWKHITPRGEFPCLMHQAGLGLAAFGHGATNTTKEQQAAAYGPAAAASLPTPALISELHARGRITSLVQLECGQCHGKGAILQDGRIFLIPHAEACDNHEDNRLT